MTAAILSRGRIALWGGALVVLGVLPLIFDKGFAISLMCQMGIMVIFSLSYNMLLGQTGLLSFGHAVYYGLGAFMTMHLLNLVQAKVVSIPVTLLPLAGGLAGLAFGLLLGYVTTRRAGTTFAMISLGVGELVAALSLMLPDVFGGEAGISGNRVVGKAMLGITFGPQIQVYYLIAGWTFVCVLAMYALTQTPLGRMANAVRDNPERAQFVGYDTQWVRFQMLVLSGFFAGIAGGLAALNYEIVTAEALSAHTSGTVLLATFLGGIGFFFGPIIGAVFVTLLSTALAGITHAWPFYFGLIFVGMVLFAPGGIASLVMLHKRLWDMRQLGRLMPVYARMAAPAALGIAGVVTLVEMSYFLSESLEPGVSMKLFGLSFAPSTPAPWVAVTLVLAVSVVLWRWSWNAAAPRWRAISAVAFGGAGA